MKTPSTRRVGLFPRKLPLPLRGICWLLVTSELFLPFLTNPALAAATEVRLAKAEPVRSAKHANPIAPANDEKPMIVNRSVPKVQPPSTVLEFQDSPSDGEITRAGVFSGPLIVTGTSTPQENRELSRALLQFNARVISDDVSSIVQFLRENPHSAWRASLLTQLGLFYRRTGYFSKALEAWEEAWQLAKNETASNSRAVADQVVGELAALNTRIGRYERLESLFKEIEGRDVHGSATEKITGAREGLWGMNNTPETAFRCGPMALDRIRAFQGVSDDDQKITHSKSSRNGFALTQVRDLANDLKMDCQMAKRQPGAAVILPCVVNWKVGHYAAILKENEGRYLVQDPTFAEGDLWVSQAALDAESSGYFLIPTKEALPKGWQVVSEAEGQTVWGKGDPGGLPPAPPPCPPGTRCGDGHGMARYSFQFLLANLHIIDFPVGYTPPRGPAMNFVVSYNHRESQQPTTFTYSNLGNKWTFGWLAYIVDQPSNTNANVSYYGQNGGSVTYTNDGVGGFRTEGYTRTRLDRLSSTNYECISPSGEVQVFSQPTSASVDRKIFLTSVIDPQGNAINFTYDAYFRLVAAQDALGQVTTISYEVSTNPASSDFQKITKVTDPFGRFATFAYNSNGQLSKITDVIGLESQFEYSSGDFISTMTTPYGTTAFSMGSDGTYKYRWLEATDPLGQKERMETRMDIQTGYPATDAVVPSGMTTLNNYLYYRNTFYWDKKAMQEGAGDYSKATVYHWLHERSFNMASHVMESMKRPLERRIWYNYPGQSGGEPSIFTGGSSSPSVSGQVLDDGTTQLYKFERNDLGNLTKETDPLGRITLYTYATNLIDLQDVRQQVGVTNQLLATYTFNAKHQPLTAVDAAGQTNYFGYNSNGQLVAGTNALGQTISLAYDGDGYLTNIIGAAPGTAVGFSYDFFGRLYTKTDSTGYTETYEYDALNRPTKVSYPDGTYAQIVYKNLDAVLTRDRRGRWSSRSFNELQQLTAAQDALGRITRLDWCKCGALGSITDPLGRVTTWVRDIRGRVTSKIYPDLTYVNYQYETNINRLKSVTDAKNQKTIYSYNVDNTVKSVTYTNALIATPTVSFTYDTNYVRVKTMTDGSGTTTYTYNLVTNGLGSGMLYSIDGPLTNDTIAYQYDQLSRVTNRAIDNVGMNVTYDILGRVVVTTNALGTFTNTYDATTMALTNVAYPNGQTMDFSYFGNDKDQTLQTIWNKSAGGATISKFDYTYDSEGQIQTWQQELGGASTNSYSFTYDPANQLLHGALSNAVAGNLIKQFFYQYDIAGNRTGEQIDMASSSASFNSLNQMTSRTNRGTIQFKGSLNKAGTVKVSGTNAIMFSSNRFVGYANTTNGSNDVVISATDYSSNATNRTYQIVVTNSVVSKVLSYDLNGNLTNEVTATQTNTYEWDAADRMVAWNSGTNRTEFTYDGMRRCVRIVERTNGIVASDKRFLWSGGKRCEERDSTGGTVTKRFLRYGEQVNGTNYYFSIDHLGSIREATDAIGDIRARYDYDPYGRRVKLSGDFEADFGFTGHYIHQASGLHLALFRAYESDAARWLSRDPIEERGGLNLYGYVGNNSVNNIDPLGLQNEMYPPGVVPPHPSFSCGFLFAASAEAGYGYGTAGNVAAGGGIFFDEKGSTSIGGFRGGGRVAGGPDGSSMNTPPSPTGRGSIVFGSGGGFGSGFFVSNAGKSSQLGGPFDQWNLNLEQFSASFASCDGVWIFGVTIGASKGVSISSYPTTTTAAGGITFSGVPDVYDPEE